MNQAKSSDITIRFETDSLNTVSLQTANKLVRLMESNSLEDLVQLLLRNLAAETGLIPTSRLVAYPLQGKYLPKFSLHELMAGVTEENKHDLIDWG